MHNTSTVFGFYTVKSIHFDFNTTFITRIASFKDLFKTFKYKEAQKLFSLYLCGKF